MKLTGFTDITEHKFLWPIGPWPRDSHLKELGRWGERNWVDGMEGWVMALFTRVLGVSLSFSSPTSIQSPYLPILILPLRMRRKESKC